MLFSHAGYWSSNECLLCMKKTAKELDDNVSKLAVSEEIMSDISPLPSNEMFQQESVPGKDILRL